ncbi:hypothetical protein P9112_011317 [Eukaryota sp. TZLM1-RC]
MGIENRSIKIVIGQSKRLSAESTEVSNTEFDESEENDDEITIVSESTLEIWKKVLNIHHSALNKNANGYLFNGSIPPDGFGV